MTKKEHNAMPVILSGVEELAKPFYFQVLTFFSYPLAPAQACCKARSPFD
jgi:hypothetical protein